MHSNTKLLVSDIIGRNIKITSNPIIYYWWFRSDCLSNLLYKLNNVCDSSKILRATINDIEYALLYVGKAKNGNSRLIKYHILDSNNFHQKGVQNGRLSSLRTTLCGLLDYPMSLSKEKVDFFIAQNCMVEWGECSEEELLIIEKEKIQSNYLPLNFQHTKNILSKEHRMILSHAKKQMRY